MASSLTKRLNKLERLSVASLSSQFEYLLIGKARSLFKMDHQKGASALLTRLERCARGKRFSLFSLFVIDEDKSFITLTADLLKKCPSGTIVIKLFTAVIYNIS